MHALSERPWETQASLLLLLFFFLLRTAFATSVSKARHDTVSLGSRGPSVPDVPGLGSYIYSTVVATAASGPEVAKGSSPPTCAPFSPPRAPGYVTRGRIPPKPNTHVRVCNPRDNLLLVHSHALALFGGGGSVVRCRETGFPPAHSLAVAAHF
jgi:hypothetical protein